MFPSSASLATVSSDEEGADARRGSAAPPRVVAFDDSDDGAASDDNDVARGPPLVVRGPAAARYGSADAVDAVDASAAAAAAAAAASAALSNSFDDFGVAEEHEAAMTHLLSASVGARTYGATTSTTTTRDAFDDEDTGDVAGSGARHIGGVTSRNGDGDGNGPVVRFGNAIPAATVTGTIVDSEVSAAFKRRRGGGTDGAVAFTNALPRIR